MVLAKHCSPGLELITVKCRPFPLPREFTSVIITTIYIPPQADTDTALKELSRTLRKQQNDNLDAAVIVAGDFNKARLKKVMPDFYQHVKCNSRGERTLDHCYTLFKDGYKAKSLPPFGKSDHAAIFLLPRYQQKLKREPPAMREVTLWSEESENMLQVPLSIVDWDVFRSEENIDEFTEAVVGFIGKLVDDTVPKAIMKTYPNQKPWVNHSIREALNEQTAAYRSGLLSGNMEEYKAATYNLRRMVKEAKRRYGEKIRSQFEQSDSRCMWQGLRVMSDYKSPTSTIGNADPSLADELNTFYARFDQNVEDITQAHVECASVLSGPVETAFMTLSEHDVRRAFRSVNTRKAAGPDGTPGRVFKTCADQLAPVFTKIFNLSLAQSTVPTCFKRSTIVPVSKNSHPAGLNDYRPVALTSIAMKCFERLVKNYICSSLPLNLDPLQFAYRTNRSTDDAINCILHTALAHLDNRAGNYVRLLFYRF
ncbi:uncharacterized protein LOC121720538 [Alosa sapidissima]|uniref:uncharacterized protein LOC121720538 n=1 Tax=Alosa sapidissima TaxID=34773 RepID=UPI001C093816|nr:uncharacterized protein LOC121720538 [Alosa sapidissima]